MELDVGPKIGDAASLWNFTPSPGWTKEEVFALKLALEKFGIGRWTEIVDSGVLPGKLIQQLNGQTQRLLGQQSLAAFTYLHVDVDAVRRDNDAKQGPDVVRKSGLIINSRGTMSNEDKKKLREENQAKYGLSKEYIDSIVLPAPVKPAHASAAVERQPQAGGHRAKGVPPAPRAVDEKISLMHSDASSLNASQLMLLLRFLHRKVHRLVEKVGQTDKAPEGGAAAEVAKKAKKRKGAPTEGDDLDKLVAFGYPRAKCADALEECGGNVEAAVEWLLKNLS